MTGRTHRVGGMLCCLGGYSLLEANGMLLGDVSPLVQLTVMYPFAIYGSVVSDLDHQWQSCPSKDVVSYYINKLIHLTSGIRDRVGKGSFLYKVLGLLDANHRSWQTHSELFLLIMTFFASMLMSSGVSTADEVLLRLIFLGLILGIISHMVLDMLTPEGIWCISKIVVGKILRLDVKRTKISFVPNTKFFRTGGKWEDMIRGIMWFVCLILLVRIIYLESPYSIEFLKG